jgi:hypothetical protein
MKKKVVVVVVVVVVGKIDPGEQRQQYPAT